MNDNTITYLFCNFCSIQKLRNENSVKKYRGKEQLVLKGLLARMVKNSFNNILKNMTAELQSLEF